jgi:HAMP domain-containing protein
LLVSRRSLKTQLLAWFGGGLAAASLISILVMYSGGRRVLESSVVQSNRVLALAIRRHLEQALSRGAAAADALGRDLVAQRGDVAGRTQLLASFLEFTDLFSNAYLFASDGTLTQYQYRPGQRGATARRGENYHAYPDPFGAVADACLAAGRPAFTPIYFTPGGRAQLSYLVPIAGRDGRPAELLSLAVYAVTEQVNSWIRELEPQGGGYIAVMDPNGRIVAMSGDAPPALARAASRRGAAPGATAAPDAGTLRAVRFDGREDLVVSGRLASTGFDVWVGLPRAVAEAPLAELGSPAALALASAMLVGILGALVLSRRILRPVADLVGGIRRVGDGVLSHRVPEGREDELGAAAAAFNRMAERLQRDQLIEELWRETRPEGPRA